MASLHGLKDLALLWAKVQAADEARIQCGCGCGVDLQLPLWFDTWPGNFHMQQVWPRESQKIKKKNNVSEEFEHK